MTFFRIACIALAAGLAACASPQDRAPAHHANVACKCDGIAEDTTCVQTAIDSQAETHFAPNQTCKLSSPLTIAAGKTVRGNGATMRFDLLNGHSGFEFTGSKSSVSGFKIQYNPFGDRKKNAVIRVREGQSDILIENNRIEANSCYQGIVSDEPGTSRVTIRNNTVDKAAYGILVNSHSFYKTGVGYQTDFVIEGNHMRNITADAIEINSPVGDYGKAGVAMRNFKIVNNDLEAGGGQTNGAGFCIGIAGLAGGEVTGNKMSNCKWQCVHIEDRAHNILVQDNSCNGPIGPKPGDKSKWNQDASAGILLLKTTFEIQVFRNTIENSAGPGIMSFADTATIAGNTIRRAGLHGIWVAQNFSPNAKSVVGPAKEFGGNVTEKSGIPIATPGAGNGSIHTFGAKNVVVIGNKGD